MAKFVFPMTLQQFAEAVKGREAAFKTIVQPGAEGENADPVIAAYKALRQGWMSKLYHKDSQGSRNELDRKIRDLAKKDPEVRRKLGMDR